MHNCSVGKKERREGQREGGKEGVREREKVSLKKTGIEIWFGNNQQTS